MSAWLGRQRKGDLQVMAHAAGLKDSDSMLKDDLVTELDSVLRSQKSSLSSNPAFKEYYDRGRGSPIKKERIASTPAAPGSPDAEAKPRRRKTLKREEIEEAGESSPAQALVARTPLAVQRLAARVPLPPSPAVVTDAIIHQQEVISNKVDELWQQSGVTESTHYIRETLSSVTSIQILFCLLEAFGLQSTIVPRDIALTVPANKALGTGQYTFYLPDLFRLLTGEFWSTSSVWVSTSIAIPLVFAYFFNLTLQSRPAHSTRAASKKPTHDVDPLTFNVVKALTTWLVYSQGFRFWGAVANETVDRINASYLGGYNGVMIGSGIGALASLYEAILAK